jgi:hypothetical protein
MSNLGLSANSNLKNGADIKIFKKGEIVWAKVRGYSWWPAKVS